LAGRRDYPEATGAIEAMGPGRDDIMYSQGIGHMSTERPVT
jgi:hypothetical protein